MPETTTDCWPHFHLSADRVKRPFGKFIDDVWSTRHVLQPSLAYYIKTKILNKICGLQLPGEPQGSSRLL